MRDILPSSPHGRKRRWIVPPAPYGTLRPLDVVQEVDGALGVVLWKLVRDTLLWGETEREAWGAIFTPPTPTVQAWIAEAEAATPELRDPVTRLIEMVASPGATVPRTVSAACKRIAGWAEEHGCVRTARLYAEAGARAAEEDAEAANLAARLNRRLGHEDRAAVWYARAIGLARRTGNTAEHIRGRLWYGFLLFQCADYRRARRHYRAAGNLARKFGWRAEAAQAEHNLLTIESDRGTFAQGEVHARRALKRYPVHHPRVPHLAHDYAYLLLQHRFFAPAQLLFDAVHPLINAPQERVVVTGNLARAAAGAGDHLRYHAASEEVLELTERSNENAARALLGIATGAYLLGDLARARETAEAVLRRAEGRQDREPLRQAECLLRLVEERVLPEPAREASAESRMVVRSLHDRLERWTAPPRGGAVRMLQRLAAAQSRPAAARVDQGATQGSG